MFRDERLWDKVMRLWRTVAQPRRHRYSCWVRSMLSLCSENVVNSECVVPAADKRPYDVAAVANSGAAAEEEAGAVTHRTFS